jgi:sporulation protein YlmC with PRC-barrel domain
VVQTDERHRDDDSPNTNKNTASDERLPLVKITDLMNKSVRGSDRDNIGQVQDLALDVDRDRVVFAVFKSGDNLVAVPFQKITIDSDRAMTAQITRDELRNAPTFSENNWSQLGSASFAQRVNQHFRADDSVYGYQRDRDRDNTRNDRDRNRNDQADDSKMRGWEPSSEYGRLFDSGTRETITGKVTSVDHFTMNNMAEGVQLRIDANNNQNVIVHLGPAWFIDHQQAEFKSGDQVQVSGSRVNVDGRNVIMAIYVRRSDRVMTLRDSDGTPVWDAWTERGQSGSAHDRDRGKNPDRPKVTNPGQNKDR